MLFHFHDRDLFLYLIFLKFDLIVGVYTKNRNFRLFLSSKLGKKNPLIVSEQNEYCSPGNTQESKLENIFYDSLVANVQ